MDSPVSDAWFTMASPSVTVPSKGITFPTCTRTWSPARTPAAGTSTSASPLTSHTLLTFNDMLLARSSTDFLCVHSSRSPPIPRRNMTEPAVSKFPLATETPMAVASRTGTSIFPFLRVSIPCKMYRTDRRTVTPARTGAGTNSLFPARSTTFVTSLSQYSRFNSLPEFCR